VDEAYELIERIATSLKELGERVSAVEQHGAGDSAQHPDALDRKLKDLEDCESKLDEQLKGFEGRLAGLEDSVKTETESSQQTSQLVTTKLENFDLRLQKLEETQGGKATPRTSGRTTAKK